MTGLHVVALLGLLCVAYLLWMQPPPPPVEQVARVLRAVTTLEDGGVVVVRRVGDSLEAETFEGGWP